MRAIILNLSTLLICLAGGCDADSVGRLDGGDESDTSISINPDCTQAATVVGTHGQLQVDERQMKNACGDVVRLRGVSSQWLNWEYEYSVSPGAMEWMVDNWNITVFRAAIVERMKGTTFLHPLVRFGFTEEERRKAEQALAHSADCAPLGSDGQADPEDAGDGEDGAETPEHSTDADDNGEEVPPPPPVPVQPSEARTA